MHYVLPGMCVYTMAGADVCSAQKSLHMSIQGQVGKLRESTIKHKMYIMNHKSSMPFRWQKAGTVLASEAASRSMRGRLPLTPSL